MLADGRNLLEPLFITLELCLWLKANMKTFTDRLFSECLCGQMTEEEKSRAVLLTMFLLAVSLPGGSVAASSDCSSPAAEANGAAPLRSAVVDLQKAERSQRRHLEALFNR